MSDGVFGKGDGGQWLPFDLLGHPVPRNKGRKGKPEHVATPENLEKIILMSAQGRCDRDCAAAIGVSINTMKKHYLTRPEIQRVRRNSKLFVEGELLARLNRLSQAGNVGATDKLLKRIDKAALGPAIPVRVAKPVKLGKKEERKIAAKYAGNDGSDWGELLNPDRAH